jgi:predicted nucleic acid binding AN1-type Zn finger protein
MDFDKMLSLIKNYNTASSAVSKNEGVLLNVVDNVNIPNNSSNEPSIKKTVMRWCVDSCKKKLSLSNNFTCKCDKTKLYCSAHRMPEDHACTAPKEQIKLDKVVADKLTRI